MNIPPPSGPRHYGRLKYSFNSYDHWSSKNYWIPEPDVPPVDIWVPIPGITDTWVPIPEPVRPW
jgi:hypothetical protein